MERGSVNIWFYSFSGSSSPSLPNKEEWQREKNCQNVPEGLRCLHSPFSGFVRPRPQYRLSLGTHLHPEYVWVRVKNPRVHQEGEGTLSAVSIHKWGSHKWFLCVGSHDWTSQERTCIRVFYENTFSTTKMAMSCIPTQSPSFCKCFKPGVPSNKRLVHWQHF